MESGSSMPLAGFVILLLLLWLNGIFYGFSAAVHNLSENEVEKRAQEGDKKAVFLLSLINNPVSFINAIPLIVMASGVCFGAFIVPWATETFHPYIKHLAAFDPGACTGDHSACVSWYSYIQENRNLSPGEICISVYEDCRIFYQDPVPFYYVRNLYCQAGSKTIWCCF